MSLSVKQLKQILSQRGVDISDCIEKVDLAKKYVASCPKVGSMQTTTQKIGDLTCTVLNKVGESSSEGIGIILMHGYGANRHDLFPFINGLLQSYQSPNNVSIRCILPDAPISLAGQGSGRAWFPLNVMQLATTPPLQIAEMTLPGLDDARKHVENIVNDLLEQNFKRVIISGFSQGAILSAHTSFNMSDVSCIRGLGLFSCAVQARKEWEEAAKKFKGVKVLLSHGKSDPIIPFAMGEMMNTILSNAGIDVEFISFEGGHTIPMNVMEKFCNLITSASK